MGLVALTIALMPVLANAQDNEQEEKATPVAIETVDGETVVVLKPGNTRIEFVGTHVGDDPKPRLGGFEKFSGTIGIKDNKPVSVNVEMEIASIWTEFDNLTKHLMNADFFEVEKFPKSTFKSNSITVLGDGNCTISGELTLHGSTSVIEFPAKYSVAREGLVLVADFKIDRTDFGMDKMTDGVEKEVSLTVVVGKATRGVESKAGNGNDESDEQASTDTPAMESTTVKVNLPKMI